MKLLILSLIMISFVVISGCTEKTDSSNQSIRNENVEIMSQNLAYPAYLAEPAEAGKMPAIVLIHSFRGLEPGYKTISDNLAKDGYIVISPQWQTFNNTPADEIVGGLISDSVAYLKAKPNVDMNRLGLTGFCAGGRYTMLFLPQMNQFRSGVAWYGFPYSGGFANQSKPIDFIEKLNAPMLMIHGTHDAPSPIGDIYRYATALNATGKYFELKVYQGKPHGFMIENGSLSQSFEARDAYNEMVGFFNRTLTE
ncbi:MAG: dienelactone hydrolase family protein [Candidatus Methanoperedens sp.]|nr:dienelactone hydrolase family protein [Candidatus Methanoperedens sp.]